MIAINKDELLWWLDKFYGAFISSAQNPVSDMAQAKSAYMKFCRMIDKHGDMELIRVVNHDHDLNGEQA